MADDLIFLRFELRVLNAIEKSVEDTLNNKYIMKLKLKKNEKENIFLQSSLY